MSRRSRTRLPLKLPRIIRRAIMAGATILGSGTLASPALSAHLHFGWLKVDGINLFYREGGRADAPTIVFLHGNPTSSIQYGEVMQNLLDRRDVHVIAMAIRHSAIQTLPITRLSPTPSIILH